MPNIPHRTLLPFAITVCAGISALAQSPLSSHTAPNQPEPAPRSAAYAHVQARLARGWNTWDVHSVATQVLLPEGLAIHVGLKHNTTLNGDAFLADALIGRLDPNAEKVTPGAHAWDGTFSNLRLDWRGHQWEILTVSSGRDISIVVTPLSTPTASALPPTLVVWVDYLWNRPGTVIRHDDFIEATSPQATIPIYCSCQPQGSHPASVSVPVAGPYFAADLTQSIAITTSRRRSLDEIGKEHRDSLGESFRGVLTDQTALRPVYDAIRTTLGWDTIYDPEKQRVFSPVSRVWSVGWGGYVLFDWDTFFAATMASMGDKDLAYANALETLREETPAGFVPNYARAGNWKSFDRSEPPVGAITILGLYRQFHDRWFIEEAFEPLLRWNRWWSQRRDLEGTITLGSDSGNQPRNPDDASVGTWQGAVYESGLDNSPMYDGTVYNEDTHLLEYADVGMTSLYIADCDALAELADTLNKPAESVELRDRAAHYRAGLARLWNPEAGIFENRNLHTNAWVTRLSPTNFYPLLAKAATPDQAKTMIEKHLLNPDEFWGDYVIPSIARNDPAFKDQNYWRGRIWGPMNYLVYLGLENYADPRVRQEFAERSDALFRKEWQDHGHVHENYNAITGSGDDVSSSDRFYHWGALLGYIRYLEQSAAH